MAVAVRADRTLPARIAEQLRDSQPARTAQPAGGDASPGPSVTR
ncbi:MULTISPECIES: hypothetical protein [unclassified Streptomyces]